MALNIAVNIISRIDTRAIEGVVADKVAPGVQKAAGKVRDSAKDILTASGRVDTGTLRRGVTAETSRIRGQTVTARVVSEQPYAGFIHEGTTGPILPRRARVLRFTPRGGPVVYARQVRGIKGVPYLTDALERLRTSDFA